MMMMMICNWHIGKNLRHIPGEGGGGTKNVPTPYPFIYQIYHLYNIFGRKDTPVVYLPLTNGTLFVHIPLEISTLAHIT